jgi:glycosyltransferase involved in cell wall biosynthesis
MPPAHDTGAAMTAPELTLVVPTYNERESVMPLLAAIDTALSGVVWEALFVDDSTDGTDRLLTELGAKDPRVRVLHRSVNRGGLAGAVVDGLREARGTYLCVLDADLQHPPERVPALLATARARDADIVIASRYVPGGSAGGLDGHLRKFYSRGLKQLSLMTFPRQLAGITDPLGGYFLLHRNVIQGVALRPIGYKILLEILVRCRWDHAAELPYVFQQRQHGTSKADFREGLRFLQHLATLALDCSPAMAPLRLAARLGLSDRPVAAGSRS